MSAYFGSMSAPSGGGGNRSVSPSQEERSVAPSQQGSSSSFWSNANLTKEQEDKIKSLLMRQNIATRIGGMLTGLPVSGIMGLLGGKPKENIRDYAVANPVQRLQIEQKNPAMTGWAHAIGLSPMGSMGDYQKWAESRGLRMTPQREGGGGIGDLRAEKDEGELPAAVSPIQPSGARPYSHYEWDAGINIPSPSDPRYTEYMAYLAQKKSGTV